nr:unnamed protein product [Digitaria exilis]
MVLLPQYTTRERDDDDDDAIWIPPADEAAADMMAAAADEYATATRDDEEEESHGRRAEERQKAMVRAMNGQLKMLAARFLESAGGIPAGWLDIVTSLSWEAALVIRPDDGASGNDMDPSSYVKVKCLASGTRRQSEVIRGLVFKKNAAHKHMPTRCHSPRLLLLRGVLGDSDNIAFSSFSSIEQEKDQLDKSVCKMMDICRPNVIMVEKTVSRDIQELLLKQGVTLIIDMKLNRLQKIARCSGSPILSFSEVLSRKPKLRQCDYFHIDKVPEEHNHSTTVQAGKIRQSKTLMFLEGFHKPLGCTITDEQSLCSSTACFVCRYCYGEQIVKNLRRLGSKVAMFQYSSVEIYTACKPQHTLEFHNPSNHEWYGQEVLARGVMIFSEVTGLLQDLKDQVSDMEIYNGAFIPIKEFSQLEDLLIKEKSEFMCTLAQAVDGTVPSSVHEILNVNWLYQYLLLELYVWDRRLHQLLRCISAEKERIEIGVKETSEFTGEQTAVVAEVDDIAECTGRKASLQPEKFSEPGIDLLDENAWDKHNEEAHRSEVHFSGISNCLDVQSNGLVARSMSPKQEQLSIPQQFRLSQWDWVWNPLPESRLAYRQELEVG